MQFFSPPYLSGFKTYYFVKSLAERSDRAPWPTRVPARAGGQGGQAPSASFDKLVKSQSLGDKVKSFRCKAREFLGMRRT